MCHEQNQELHMVFVDIPKTFDTVNCNLWKILHRFGYPEKLVSLIESFHDGMQARVQENGEQSEALPVKNGLKQGCMYLLQPPLQWSLMPLGILIKEFTYSFDQTVNSTTYN